ncbi:hypothetical protein ANMWB30_30620 [Arthrobacter sp. MWB30]|nr:hypothetical protein ANMWB30_30620 [Arthrobacter sp. MWB30]
MTRFSGEVSCLYPRAYLIDLIGTHSEKTPGHRAPASSLNADAFLSLKSKPSGHELWRPSQQVTCS